MYVFDLVLATRRAQLTGVERYGVNLFETMRELHPNTIAFVKDASIFTNKTGVIEVKSVFLYWLFLPCFILVKKITCNYLVAPSFPPSPFFYFSGYKKIRIIHDAFPWDPERKIPLLGSFVFKHLEKLMSYCYNYVFVPMQNTADEIRALKIFSNVACCGSACGVNFPQLAPEPVEHLSGKPYILSVGTVEPRKNYEKIIKLAENCQQGWTYVVVGKAGWGESIAALTTADERMDNFIWLKNTSDTQLYWLYLNAFAFLTPSFAEGLNMPLVEAGGLGKKIICSDIKIHQHVAPKWAAFFSLLDSENVITQKILQAATPTKIEKRDYSKQHSWAAVAENINEAVHEQT